MKVPLFWLGIISLHANMVDKDPLLLQGVTMVTTKTEDWDARMLDLI